MLLQNLAHIKSSEIVSVAGISVTSLLNQTRVYSQ